MGGHCAKGPALQKNTLPLLLVVSAARKTGPLRNHSAALFALSFAEKMKKQIFLKKGLHFPFEYCIINNVVTGCGAVGSALDWGSRGREFKSRHSDQISTIVLIRRYLKLSCFFFW